MKINIFHKVKQCIFTPGNLLVSLLCDLFSPMIVPGRILQQLFEGRILQATLQGQVLRAIVLLSNCGGPNGGPRLFVLFTLTALLLWDPLSWRCFVFVLHVKKKTLCHVMWPIYKEYYNIYTTYENPGGILVFKKEQIQTEGLHNWTQPSLRIN